MAETTAGVRIRPHLPALLVFAGVTATMAMQNPAWPEAGSSANVDAKRFDGTRGVTLTCPDFKDAGAGAKGYTFRFLATVKDGVLHARHGTEGLPSSPTFDGAIEPDGSAEIQAHGRSGDPDYTVGRVQKSTAYSYRVKAQFEGSRATGKRLDLRPCEVVLVKQ